MKKIGYILIAVGLAMLFFVAYYFWSQQNRIISPVPYGEGVKVIFITPQEK